MFLAVTLGEGEGGLCGSVNAKNIVVVETVVRLVLEVLVIAGVVATIKKAGGGVGEGAAPPPRCESSMDSAILLLGNTISYLSTRELPRLKDHKTSGLGDQGTRSRCPLDQETEGAGDQRSRRARDQRTRRPKDQGTADQRASGPKDQGT